MTKPSAPKPTTPKLTTDETRRLLAYLTEQNQNLARTDELLTKGDLTEDDYKPLIREFTRAVILRAAITSMLEVHGMYESKTKPESKTISYKSKNQGEEGEAA